MVAFKVFTHALMLSFFHGSDVLQPMLVFYDFISHHPSKNALETSPSFSSSFSAFRMQAGSVRLSRAHLMLFSVIFFVYSNLRAIQSVKISLLVCLFIVLLCFACLFFDSTNSERCFAILRANTNYNFLIYGNDFTQIQEIRSHCRPSALLITTGNQIISKLFDYRCRLLRLNWLFVN